MWSGQVEKFLLAKFKVWDARLVIQSTWLFQESLLLIFKPRYLAVPTATRDILCKVIHNWFGFLG